MFVMLGRPAANRKPANCHFRPSVFQTLHNLIPSIGRRIVLEDEHHNPANGDGAASDDGVRTVAGGLLVWRKADNFTAFTDGYRTLG